MIGKIEMGQKDILLARMDDLADKAVKTGCAMSRFLTPTESHSVAMRFDKRRDVSLPRITHKQSNRDIIESKKAEEA